MVKTTDCGSVMRGFESHHPPHKTDSDFCWGLFYLCGEGENPPFVGSCIIMSFLILLIKPHTLDDLLEVKH